MKGMGSTGATGGSRGSVGVTPTGIEIGIDIGIGGLGISTDYGGGIVVSIGGQKIVWGREGGKIHYNLGGFEVLVEARNCVVVETRKIAGQVVGIHTYPDPGCKLPPEPPTPTPTPTPTNDPSQGIKIPATEQLMWVPCIVKRNNYDSKGNISSWIEMRVTISDKEDKEVSGIYLPFEMKTSEWNSFEGERIQSRLTVKKGTYMYAYLLSTGTLDPRFGYKSEIPSVATGAYKNWFYGVFAGFRDTGLNVNKYINSVNQSNDKYLANPNNYQYGNAYTITYKPIDYIIVGKQDRPQFFPSPGNQPPMPDKCCESLKADIEDIKEVLATKEILAGEMTVPWKLRIPGGQGEEVIMDYPNYLRALGQMIDHLGIHPPRLSVKDINNAIAGDQSIENQFPSATQGFEALMSQIWDANADVDTLTNFLYRLSWLCVQQSMNLARLSGDVQVLKDMLGGETEPTETSITTPFNIGAGVVDAPTKGKGFGKKGKRFGKKQKGDDINRQIDANTELSTESLLPDFLKIRENPIIIERFSGNKDVMDKLDFLIMQMERLQGR